MHILLNIYIDIDCIMHQALIYIGEEYSRKKATNTQFLYFMRIYSSCSYILLQFVHSLSAVCYKISFSLF